MNLKIDTKGNPKQKEALKILLDQDSPIRSLGYGGAAGGAKSYTGVIWV